MWDLAFCLPKESVISDQEILERTVYALVNEAARLLQEGIACGPPKGGMHTPRRPTTAIRIATPDTAVRRAGGALYLKSRQALGPYPRRLTERLEHWAREASDRVFLAQRFEGGQWRTLSYAETLAAVRRVGQALLDRGLSAERPVLILSGNGIEHALLALAAMHVGVLYVPVAPAYSLQARDYALLGQVVESVRPALVFAADGAAYANALRATLPPRAELVVSTSAPEGIAATPFAALEQTAARGAVDEAHGRVGPDTVAKVLFTSGSTGVPRGVLNTQRMLCANQEMLRSVLQFLADEPPVLCDWLPWNHTAGGNHNFGLVLYNGGSLYIDEGRPLPGAFETTLANLREVSATAHFTVPRTYEMLLPHLRTDSVLRQRFFAKLRIFFYAAAGLPQRVFDDLQELARATRGEELLWVTGMGATETAPFALCTGDAGAWSGFIGHPAPGLELKLAPVGEKLEARVRGASVTPGYFRDPDRTVAAFDDEGFYRLGDAVKLVDPEDASAGLIFDGRLADDFKLSSGTWVHVGALRSRILGHGGEYLDDVVIAGHDREFVTALVFPNLSQCRSLCPELGELAPASEVIAHPRVRDRIRSALRSLAADGAGTSTVVARAVLLDEPPCFDALEVTGKGSLNQKAVLENRREIVDQLYAGSPGGSVIVVLDVEDNGDVDKPR
jgi:feruloyl-CoA synthase